MKMFVLYLPAQDVMEKNRLYERMKKNALSKCQVI